MKQVFVTGIGTDVGKTVVSAILTEALQADYWKPVQAGDLENSDTIKVKNLVSNEKSVFHAEAYRLPLPLSPHAAAAAAGIELNLNKFALPATENNLVIEGAGGLFVPLNDQSLIIDLIQSLKVPVILVSANYLGSINHTLLSVEALKNRNIPMAGIIFNGEPTPASEEYILQFTGLTKLLAVLPEKEMNKQVVKKYAVALSAALNTKL